MAQPKAGLKSLADFNQQRHKTHRAASLDAPRPNGIACPKCGFELVDFQPLVTLTSDPPLKAVNCPKCSWNGYRVA